VANSGRALLPLVTHQVPVVCLNRRVYDLDLDVALVDNVAGAILAVSHLAALGHRRIGYINGRPVTPGIERLEGYRQGLAAYDLPRPPTAIFAINNPMALGALTAIRERGWRVPADISVVAFDDAPWSALLDPPLTTVAQPTDQLGRAAVRLLLERIDGYYDGAARRVVLPPSLIERASTGPVGAPVAALRVLATAARDGAARGSSEPRRYEPVAVVAPEEGAGHSGALCDCGGERREPGAGHNHAARPHLIIGVSR